MAPQSMASVFSLGNSDHQSHRYVSVFISCTAESQRRSVSGYDSHRPCMVYPSGPHSMDTHAGRICHIRGIPRGTRAQF